MGSINDQVQDNSLRHAYQKVSRFDETPEFSTTGLVSLALALNI